MDQPTDRGAAIRSAVHDACLRMEVQLEKLRATDVGMRQLRRDHAAWSQETFGQAGPTGALRHLAEEALEAAAAPDDLSEWADIYFLIWDAQRRAGITDAQIVEAGRAKLEKNRRRDWGDVIEGEPIKHRKGHHD